MTGSSGLPGNDGLAGRKGLAGEPGEGIRGPQGDKGNRGQEGFQGVVGDLGPPGPKANQGLSQQKVIFFRIIISLFLLFVYVRLYQKQSPEVFYKKHVLNYFTGEFKNTYFIEHLRATALSF